VNYRSEFPFQLFEAAGILILRLHSNKPQDEMMKRISGIFIVLSVIFAGFLPAKNDTGLYRRNWPAWRGPLSTGEAPEGDPPVEFSERQAIRWKIPIPGKGLSTPVIWGDQIFLTSAVSTEKPVNPEDLKNQPDAPLWLRSSGQAKRADKIQQFFVYSIGRENGKIQWQKIVHEALPYEGTHKDGSWASHSCVTDGSCVIAYFGSYGIYCFDMQGNLLWEKNLGRLTSSNSFGTGSSPALYGNSVIIKRDHEGESSLLRLDKQTGEIIWSKARDEGTSWSTPLIAEVRGQPQIVVSATGLSGGYQLESGELIWTLGGLTRNVIPSPVAADGLAVLMSGYRGNAVQVIRLEEARGRLDNSKAVVWTSSEKITPYVPSPLLYQGNLYFLYGNDDKLTCMDVRTGDIRYVRESIDGIKGVYASPVGAGNRIYIAGRNGAVAVLQAGPAFQILAVNSLDDGFDASPAVAGKDLILRGIKHVYCLARE
jgi:outer membrane protein assembly factor BamB